MKTMTLHALCLDVLATWLRRFALTALLIPLLLAAQPLQANSAQPYIGPPNPLKPTLVDVYFYLDDLGNINLGQGTFEATGQLVLKWQDSRMAFDPAGNGGQDRRMFVGPGAEAALTGMWRPWIEVSGQRGVRALTTQALVITSTGSVELRQNFHAYLKFTGELVRYPFGSLKLPFAIMSMVNDSTRVQFNPQVVDPANASGMVNVLHGNWAATAVDWSVSDVRRDDVPDTTFQQFEVTIQVVHDFIDGLHKIFLPLLVIGMASFSFMHLNHVAQGSYSSPRIGGFMTLILTCIALKLALRGELPVVHYGTLTDALFNLTIVMLLIGLVSSCYLATLATSGKEQSGRRLHERLKWGYPALYTVAVGLVCVQFFVRL